MIGRIPKHFVLAKRIARLLCRLAYRVCTRRLRVLPDFFVIGPPRSGTTSLAYYISQHPSYVRPFMKELDYSEHAEAKRTPHGHFNQTLYMHLPAALRRPLMRAVQGLYYQGGASGYRKLFPLATTMRSKAHGSGRAITGDYTLFGLYNYATTEAFPYRMTGDGTKFITILRNPVDFLYSFYTKEISSHFRVVDRDVSFDQFVRCPEELYVDGNVMRGLSRMLEQWRPHFERYSFFDESQYTFATFMVSYVVFLEQWASRLSSDRLLVLSFTDLCEHPRETMASVFDFLEIPLFEVPDLRAVNANVYAQDTVPQETAGYVRDVCKPYNEELYRFIGRELGWD